MTLADRLARAGLGKSRILALLFSLAVSAAIFSQLYRVAYRTVLNEIRMQAMGIALAMAASTDPADVAMLRGIPEDEATEVFQRLRHQYSSVSRYSPDVYSVYLMGRSTAPSATSADYRYLVDDAPEDVNQDGEYDESELPMPPGTAYDASDMPAMVAAWDGVAADETIYEDPPYPDSMSGYAPVRGPDGRTLAIVGVDVPAVAIASKLLRLRLAMAAGALLMASLLAAALFFYLGQRDLALQRQALISELREAVDRVQTLSGLLPICSACKKIRNDEGEWERLESYLGHRSGAEFSHSICPDCAKQLYAEGSATRH